MWATSSQDWHERNSLEGVSSAEQHPVWWHGAASEPLCLQPCWIVVCLSKRPLLIPETFHLDSRTASPIQVSVTEHWCVVAAGIQTCRIHFNVTPIFR